MSAVTIPGVRFRSGLRTLSTVVDMMGGVCAEYGDYCAQEVLSRMTGVAKVGRIGGIDTRQADEL